MLEVAIVEDKSDFRAWLADLIRKASGLTCVGTFGSAEQALATLPRAIPDVVLMDIHLPNMSGIECTARIRRLFPSTQVLILTVFEESDQIFAALEAGASGYLLKRAKPDEILQAIREVRTGGAPMTPEIARRVVASFHRQSAGEKDCEKLTAREEQILKFLAKGYITKEIADQLGISFETVRTHLRHIYDKLHVRSRTEAVIKYLG